MTLFGYDLTNGKNGCRKAMHVRASPARLLAAAEHLMRMQAVAREQARLNIPLHLRLTGEALVEATADPADTLITSLLLNREFQAENPGDPSAIAERAIAAARRSAGAS